MKTQNLIFLAVWLVLTTLSCNQNAKQENNSDKKHLTQIGKFEVKSETEKWKQELLKNKEIGSPCFFRKTLDSLDFIRWNENNPNQQGGLPFDDKEIKSLSHDLDNDKKKDLLLYFTAENCTGHNGGSKTYAIVIYSDNTRNANLMNEIIVAIQAKYNQMAQTNKRLKKVTNSYLERTTTIEGYQNGIVGRFSLYAKNDAHCCPSYKGNYFYKNALMEIEISENEKNNC